MSSTSSSATSYTRSPSNERQWPDTLEVAIEKNLLPAHDEGSLSYYLYLLMAGRSRRQQWDKTLNVIIQWDTAICIRVYQSAKVLYVNF